MDDMLRYGPQIGGYGTKRVSQFDELRLQLGMYATPFGETQPIASFKMYGISIFVTDKVVAGEIHDMLQIGKDATLVEPYLERILFIALQQNPEHLEKALASAFSNGVRQGRQDKGQEIRNALNRD